LIIAEDEAMSAISKVVQHRNAMKTSFMLPLLNW